MTQPVLQNEVTELSPNLGMREEKRRAIAESLGDAKGWNVAGAQAVGAEIARKAGEAGIKQICFDRGGNRYHGRVNALADAAREGGLEF